MTGVVLAGGLSSRMGRDKSALPWQGTDFLHAILEKLSTVCDELIVVTNQPWQLEPLNAIVVPDLIPQCGPLSGIHSGLVHSASSHAFVTACDMPHLVPLAVSHICSLIDGHDAVVPGTGEDVEPLFACYAKTCIPVIETLLRKNIRKAQDLFGHVRCKNIQLDDLRQFDPTLRMLCNINSLEEYHTALSEMEGQPML